MTVLVVGASGATGRKLVDQLFMLGLNIKVVVRSSRQLPAHWKETKQIQIHTANLLDLSDAEMRELVQDCSAVVSCLGHNLTWKGIYGHPRKLVTGAIQRLCKAVEMNAPKEAIKFVLMNTTGNRNRELNETLSLAEKVVLGLIRWLLPPHTDNEAAADYLQKEIGKQNTHISWVAVRPDSLINEEEVSAYSVFPSPIRSALFKPGKTSRINVAHFMAALIFDAELWTKWQGQMPVVYNSSSLD